MAAQDLIDELRTLVDKHGDKMIFANNLEVWLWLWREKLIQIPVGVNFTTLWIPTEDGNMHNKGTFKVNDPEEAIIAAIEYIVEHNLLK